jgi:hypothetical protein
MPSSALYIDIRGLPELTKWMEESPRLVEKAINDWMHGEAITLMTGEMQPLIPVSTGPPARWTAHTPHAKFVPKWYSATKSEPQATTIGFSNKQWYLRYPETGTGTSRHRGDRPLDLLEKGAEASMDRMLAGMAERIMWYLN